MRDTDWLHHTTYIHTYIALGFIRVSTNNNRAALHESHDSLKMPLVDDASVVLKSLWIVCVKLLYCVKGRSFKNKRSINDRLKSTTI